MLTKSKISKGHNSLEFPQVIYPEIENTGDRVMVLAFCNSPHSPLSVYQVSFIFFNTFRDMLWTSLLLQKLGREITL